VHDAGEIEAQFPLHVGPQLLIELREHRFVGRDGRKPAELQPLPAKLSTSALLLGSAIIRRTCASSVSGLCSSSRCARANNSSSGILLHRKYDIREANSKSLIRCGAVGIRVGIGFDAKQELRRRQHRLKRQRKAAIECAGRVFLVDPSPNRHQAIELVVFHRPAKCVIGELRSMSRAQSARATVIAAIAFASCLPLDCLLSSFYRRPACLRIRRGLTDDQPAVRFRQRRLDVQRAVDFQTRDDKAAIPLCFVVFIEFVERVGQYDRDSMLAGGYVHMMANSAGGGISALTSYFSIS